jgi:4'-phosphopantetheinyl transferase
LQFCYSPHGKPALADADTTGMLQFNLSHSGGVALYAVACERQIGIDIERLRRSFVVMGLLKIGQN